VERHPPKANLRGNPQEGIELAGQALALLPDDPGPRTFATLSSAAAYSSAGKLLAAFEQKAATSPTDERLAEPLSEREFEVLALIAAGESNREISARLFISTSTVKSHVNNLFRKLQARNRTQATARAREMNLL
jgi:ATP/maltotriose-dependent transcriptional regulator MalT